MTCFRSFDLDLMTLTYETDLDILMMYLHTENKVCRSRLSEVTAQTGQTDTTLVGYNNLQMILYSKNQLVFLTPIT